MTFDHVARKGYTKVLTQAEQRLARLWTILFDLEIVDSPPVEIAGHPEPYLTVVGTIPASSDPITMESSSAMLLRIEGQWDAPSSFETA
ncbi:hypothetical protein [Rhizobium sp. CF142]|jgi:hypothetical protein|uniref:hypothetical protein n=2 Tax=Rhizobium TaxID=379 RepID=UPI001FCB9A70|nr:hypothetical protein [Rhizobium sp. CF142]